MTQYIDKDALVAEIEKIIPSEPYPKTSETLYGAEKYGKREMCFKILDLIGTLGVKEVDLEKEISNYLYSHLGRPRMELELDWTQYDISCKADKLVAFAQHFFELGLKVQKGE